MGSSKLRMYQASIFGTLFFGYAIYTLNRKSVELVMPQLIDEGLDINNAGLMMSCHKIAFAVSKFMSGVLSDKISPRYLFAVGITLCGLVTIVFSSLSSPGLFVFLWFINGIGQGCGWPACSKILRQWYPPTQFGTWWSILSASANISGALSPIISTILIANYGWRYSIFFSGFVSVVLGVIALTTLVSSPSDVGIQPFTTSAKEKDKNGLKDGERLSEMTSIELLKCRSLWLVSFCFMVVSCTRNSVSVWGQMLLLQDKKQTPYVASAFTSSVEWGGFIGRIAAGYFTDLAVKKRKSTGEKLGHPRMPLAVYMTFLGLVSLHVLQFTVVEGSSVLWILAIGFVLGISVYGTIAIYGVVANEIAPSHLSGTSHAFAALAANVGAVVSGLPFSFIAKYYSWSAVFFLLELGTIFTAAIMLLFRNIDYNMDKKKAE